MKSYAIIGCGRFGRSVAETLFELGNEVLAVDKDPELIKEISEHVTYAVEADAMDEAVLRELGLSNFDVVVISIGSDLEASIMATIVAKELGVKKVVAKTLSELQGKVLEKVGADKVIFPERDMGVRVAHNLVSANILDYIELSPEYNIAEIVTPKEWHGKSLEDLNLRAKYGINVVAIKRDNEINVTPPANGEVEAGDIVVAIGESESLNKLEDLISK